jgi:hypothetical protein
MERPMDDEDKQTEPTSGGEEVAYESDWYEVLKRRAEEEGEDDEVASVDGDDG